MCTPPYVATKKVVIVFNGDAWERYRKWILKPGYGNESPPHEWRLLDQTYKFRGEAITASVRNADEIVFCQEVIEKEQWCIKLYHMYLSSFTIDYANIQMSDMEFTEHKDKAHKVPRLEASRLLDFAVNTIQDCHMSNDVV